MDRKTDGSLLVKGNELHRILKNEKFIFKVSSTLEKLYRYRIDPDTKKVIEIVVFKRVRNVVPEFERLRCLSPKRMPGTPTAFCGKTYDIYALISKGYLSGYMLYSKAIYGDYQTAETERLYFAFEKYEKKER